MNRLWHNHIKWEDYLNNMYETRKDEDFIKQSQMLLSDPYKLFFEMVKVTIEWPVCSEFNLSNTGQNRKAWLGWASCCIHHGATDDETKAAWNMLCNEQKEAANESAKSCILAWEKNYYGVIYAKNTVRH